MLTGHGGQAGGPSYSASTPASTSLWPSFRGAHSIRDSQPSQTWAPLDTGTRHACRKKLHFSLEKPASQEIGLHLGVPLCEALGNFHLWGETSSHRAREDSCWGCFSPPAPPSLRVGGLPAMCSVYLWVAFVLPETAGLGPQGPALQLGSVSGQQVLLSCH